MSKTVLHAETTTARVMNPWSIRSFTLAMGSESRTRGLRGSRSGTPFEQEQCSPPLSKDQWLDTGPTSRHPCFRCFGSTGHRRSQSLPSSWLPSSWPRRSSTCSRFRDPNSNRPGIRGFGGALHQRTRISRRSLSLAPRNAILRSSSLKLWSGQPVSWCSGLSLEMATQPGSREAFANPVHLVGEAVRPSEESA